MMPNEIISYTSLPSNQGNNISKINSSILFEGLFPHSDFYEVNMNNELLRIPYRIYFKEPDNELISQLNAEQVDLLNCFYTRHYNGYIRERKLKEIIMIDRPIVVPFVIQLAGEYVYEILEIIYDHLDHLNLNNYLNFIAENPIYYQKTRARMISYWNCNYRNEYKDLRSYKGLQIFKCFESKLK